MRFQRRRRRHPGELVDGGGLRGAAVGHARDARQGSPRVDVARRRRSVHARLGDAEARRGRRVRFTTGRVVLPGAALPVLRPGFLGGDLPCGAAKHGGDACCYQEDEPVPLGRPLRGPLGPLVASAPSGGGAWVRDALLEHASVASFARLALELLSMGAPSELVRGAHEAALDELRHADVCFALAGARAPRLGALPVGRALPLARDRVELALRSIEEGCIGEAFAACEAFEVAARSDDARVAAALSAIARDEARHAELAARVAAWALRTATPAERQRIAAGVDELRGKAAPHFEGAEGDEGGRLGRVARASLWATVQRDVVQPTLRALVSEDRLSTYG